MQDDVLSTLIGSRICHDLISPLGAIGNGVELLEMSGAAQSPEMVLISESVKNANARLRLFRLAFGGAQHDNEVKASEVRDILWAYSAGAKCDFDWLVGFDLKRSATRIGLLALLCLETAAPFGGRLVVSEIDGSLEVNVKAERLLWDMTNWDRVETGDNSGLSASQVQFSLLHRALRDARMGMTVSASETEHRLSIRPL